MEKRIIETVYVDFKDGEKIIKRFSSELLSDKDFDKKKVFYRYYDDDVKGDVLISVLDSGYYENMGYGFRDKELEKLLNI